jgi:hypothetical protein
MLGTIANHGVTDAAAAAVETVAHTDSAAAVETVAHTDPAVVEAAAKASSAEIAHLAHKGIDARVAVETSPKEIDADKVGIVALVAVAKAEALVKDRANSVPTGHLSMN